MLIADSSAVLDIRRILPQHLSAITLMNTKLQNPAQQQLFWLDLACGKGQIISQLSDNLSLENRKKLNFVGYDISPEHTRIAEKFASSLDLHSYSFYNGDLSNFTKIIPEEQNFDFISCTNTIHELQPSTFARLLINTILRLTENGELFFYDMESLDSPELGALPWRGEEIRILMNAFLNTLGTKYLVHPNVWNHSTCNGWTVVVQRQYIGKSNEEILKKQASIIEQLDQTINQLIERRFNECKKALITYQKCGAETAEEAKSQNATLYEFWAIHYAKEMR